MTPQLLSKTLTFLAVFCTLSLCAVTASAQWQWIDKDGRKVFSDRSPPAEIQEKNILKRATGASRESVPASAPDSSLAAKAAGAASVPALKASGTNLPKLSGKDSELEAKKRKAEEEDLTKKKAEEDKAAKIKIENCERAKTGLATLQSGVRMSSVNAKGEREIFDDAKRAAEVKRAQEVIEASCK